MSFPEFFYRAILQNFVRLCVLICVLMVVSGLPVSDQESEANVTENMVSIEKGIFKMGCDRFGSQHGASEQMVYLDEFLIDKHEVTNEKFEKIFPEHFLRRSIFSECDQCPVSKISWYEAADYCYLIGKSLPSEAQWERAARGGKGCQFPWGEEFDRMNPPARGGLKLQDKAAPVGSFPPNRHGLYDMAGNVWEWVGDWFSIKSYYAGVLHNPRGPARGLMKVRRGGSWSDSIIAMASGYRDWSYPISRGFNDIGFRCAINLKNSEEQN